MDSSVRECFSIPPMTFRLIIFGERWGISVMKAMALSEGLDGVVAFTING